LQPAGTESTNPERVHPEALAPSPIRIPNSKDFLLPRVCHLEQPIAAVETVSRKATATDAENLTLGQTRMVPCTTPRSLLSGSSCRTRLRTGLRHLPSPLQHQSVWPQNQLQRIRYRPRWLHPPRHPRSPLRPRRRMHPKTTDPTSIA
jgi:hypothetical protein